MLEGGLGSHFEGVSRSAAADLLNGVPGGLEEDDVHLVEEEASQKTKAGRQYRYHLHRRHELAIGAEVCRDERDPNDKEYQHAERDELRFCEVLWEFTRFERKEEANGGEETGVADQKAQGHHGALVAGDEDNLIDVMVLGAGRRGVVEPHHADHHLDKGAQEHQQELQVQAPPLSVETGGDLGLEDEQHAVGLDQDAGDAEDEADPEGRLAQAARPVLRFANEHEGAGEAADEGEEEEVGKLPVGGLHDGSVAESDKHPQDEGRQQHSQHCEYCQGYAEGLRPREELDLFQKAECVVPVGP